VATTLDVPTSFRSSAVRLGAFGLLREAIGEIRSRRRLIRYLVQADLKKKGADTLLGNLWWVIDPLLQMSVYVILVAIIFGRGQPDYPLFVFAAILPWKWFRSSVRDSVTSVTSQERLIRQVQFPKIVLPISSASSGIVSFAFGLIPLAGLVILFFPHRASLFILLLPLVAAVQFAFSMALAVFLSAATVFFRDINNVARHVLRLWFYLSPGLYSLEQVDRIAGRQEWVGTLMGLNPFATLFEGYRAVIYAGTVPNLVALGLLMAISLVLLVVSMWFFKRLEPAFAKVV
jgi:ABC-type polysaccharide/polyol phosphate export permease